ncbi:hypothetical protein [Nonomuraea recticatena]|uniref:hypothetical protein n=1 Tax=Nonomuraea recticatena TaxID=46178 RepID=UPI003619F096
MQGRKVAVGSPARLLDTGAGPRVAAAQAAAADLEGKGHTAVLVSVDGQPAGVLAIADRLRPDAAATITSLTALTGSAPCC